MGAPEGVHHLGGGVGARGVTSAAQELVLGGKAQLGGQLVLGLGAGRVHLLLGLLAVNVIREASINIRVYSKMRRATNFRMPRASFDPECRRSV